MTGVAPPAGAVRSWVGPVAVVLTCTAVDGLIGLGVGAAIASWVVLTRRPQALLACAAALFGLVPVAMLLQGLPSIESVSPSTAVGRDLAHHLAFAGFAALCAGVLLARSREAATAPPPVLSTPRVSAVLQGSAWVVLGVAVQVVLNAGFAVAAARTTDSDPLGRAYALSSVVLFIGYATGLGLGVTVARFGIDSSRNASVVFTWSVLLTTASSFVGALVCVLAVHPPGGNLLGSNLTAVLVLGTIVSGTSIAFLVDVLLQARRLWPVIAVRLALVGLVRFPLLALRPDVDQGLWVFIVIVAPSAYSGFIGLLLLPRFANMRYALRRPAEVPLMMRVAGGDWMTTLSAQAPLYILPLIVALRVTPTANASFFLAWSAGTAAFVVPAAVAQVVLVEGSRREDTATVHRHTWEAIRLSAGICAGLWIAAVVFQQAVVATLGEQFTPAARLLPTLLAGCVPAAIAAVLVSEARIERDERAVIATTLGTAIFVLGLASVWIAHDGIDGAGRAWIIGNTIGGVVAVATTIRRGRRRSRAGFERVDRVTEDERGIVG